MGVISTKSPKNIQRIEGFDSVEVAPAQIRSVANADALMESRLSEGWYLGEESGRYVWKTLRRIPVRSEKRTEIVRFEEIQEGMTQQEAAALSNGEGKLRDWNDRYLRAALHGTTLPWGPLPSAI